MLNNTIHKLHNQSSEDLSNIDDNSIHLIVTSPPYPMILMWDNCFQLQSTLDISFDNIHDILSEVWKLCYRVLVDGGIMCINIGDATGTTTLSTMCLQRNSIGIDIDSEYIDYIKHSIDNDTIDILNTKIDNRIQNHLEFITLRLNLGKEIKYFNKNI